MTARWWGAAAARGGALALLWVVLAGPSPDYALYGAVSVAAALALSLGLVPPRPPADRAGLTALGVERVGGPGARAVGAVVLAAWFLGQSVAGGVDVALRAATRTPDVRPAVVDAPVRLPPGGARTLALALMNLMPGSMAQRTRPDDGAAHAVVELHTLAAELEPADQWAALEDRVARAAGLRLPPR